MVRPQSPTCGASPELRMTKPPLLKIDIAMNAACENAESRASPSRRKKGMRLTKSTACALRATTTTARTSEPTSPRREWVSEAASMRCVSPMCRETAMPRIEARVMMPRPPIIIPTAITVCPKGDQKVAVSTVTSPVTHTDDIAVKNESTKGARWPVAVLAGICSNAVTTRTMAEKTHSARRAGDSRATVSTRSRPRALRLGAALGREAGGRSVDGTFPSSRSVSDCPPTARTAGGGEAVSGAPAATRAHRPSATLVPMEGLAQSPVRVGRIAGRVPAPARLRGLCGGAGGFASRRGWRIRFAHGGLRPFCVAAYFIMGVVRLPRPLRLRLWVSFLL